MQGALRGPAVLGCIRLLPQGELPRMLRMPLIGLIVLSLVLCGAWLRQRRTGNAGIVDVLWAAGLGGFALLYSAGAGGWWPRRLLVGGLAFVWSARLSLYLIRRVSSEPEDGRYASLREEWGSGFQTKIFWFFQAQAVLAALLSLPFLFLASSPAAGWRVQDGLAVLLWVTSVLGESVADRQLHAWRREPANTGLTCRSGLWAYSRHPNYFFEWLHWLVYPVMAIGLPGGWALWLAPAAMLYLVRRVTGIPPTEAQSLRSRGDDYRAYQQTTNAFFPGPNRRATDPETP